MPSPTNDVVPTQQSMDQARDIPLLELDIPDYHTKCCVHSILSCRDDHYNYLLTFGGNCTRWEGRVRVPVIDADPEIRGAWNRYIAQFPPPGRGVAAMEFRVDPYDPFTCHSAVGNIIELGQKSNGTPWYKRAFRVDIDGRQYDGCVYMRQNDARTAGEIKAARRIAAAALDTARDEASAVPSIEPVPAEPSPRITFQFSTYPQVGRAVEVTADGVHGYDLNKCRAAVVAMKKTGTTREVRIRCVAPSGATYWFEGSLTDGLKVGRFEEIDEP